MTCVVVRHVHGMTGADDPVDSEAVRQVRRGLVRTHGAGPRRLARPPTVEEIRHIVTGIDRTSPWGSAMPRSSCTATPQACAAPSSSPSPSPTSSPSPAELLLHIRKSKTDQEGHGQVVAVAHGQHASTDPVVALNAWQIVRGQTPGALFTRITAHSLRAGHATAAAIAGVPLDRIAAQTLHKDLTVLVNRYIRPLEALVTTSSKDLEL